MTTVVAAIVTYSPTAYDDSGSVGVVVEACSGGVVDGTAIEIG